MKMLTTGLPIRIINRTNTINHINLNKLNLQITNHSKLQTQTHGLRNNLTINIAQTNNHLKSTHLSIIKIMIPGLERQKKLQTQMKLEKLKTKVQLDHHSQKKIKVISLKIQMCSQISTNLPNNHMLKVHHSHKQPYIRTILLNILIKIMAIDISLIQQNVAMIGFHLPFIKTAYFWEWNKNFFLGME